MGINTAIDWCDSSVNPVMGCDGCELSGGHCYAERLVGRHAGKSGWPTRFDKPELIAADRRMDQAFGWPDLTGKARPDKPWLDGMPRLIFLCDLADPFTESIDPNWICQYVGRMARSPHIWILLTKRPGRMRHAVKTFCCDGSHWPRNIWGGVSVTSQDTIWRAMMLLTIPLFVRFVSAEPLLGALDFRQDWVRGFDGTDYQGVFDDRATELEGEINWVIAGGESGPNARPSHPDWFRGLRDQCADAGVPFLFKQWGEWCPGEFGTGIPDCLGDKMDDPGCFHYFDDPPYKTWRVGRKRAGRMLDGRVHLEMPKWST